jgi:CubicO group peptidase (beta-lactamase class C family)
MTLNNRLLTQTFAKAAPVKPAAKAISNDAIDKFIMDQMHRFHIPGVSLAIVEGDRIVHLRGFGRAHPHGDEPTPKTPFFIGSLTKSFTALAVMQLVEASKVELDAPVQRYLSWFRVVDPVASAQITVRHLLNHTSGLPGSRGLADLGDLDCHPVATERQVRALATVRLNHPPGSKFEYNNTNYNILGLIIETVSGETYSGFIQKHIFAPLNMSHSYTSKADAQQNGLAVGYRYWFGYPLPTRNLTTPHGSLPSGQLISSAEDIAHYLIANLNGGNYRGAQILSAAGIAEMHKGAAIIREMGLSLGFYGMGWISNDRGEARIVSHSGIVPDFGAYMAMVPEQKKGIVILFNANHAMMKLTFDELGMGAAQLLAGGNPTATLLGAAPWAMRSMSLVPVLQLISIAATLKLFGRWRCQDPALYINRSRWRRPCILFPLFLNLLTSFTLVPLLGRMRGFYKLFMPDFTWIALVCGSIAGVWTFLHTILIFQIHKTNASKNL